jgi:mannose-1-phosphate guanylyltransferase
MPPIRRQVPKSQHAIPRSTRELNLFTTFGMAFELHTMPGATMTSTSNGKHTWAVVLAGGDGIRLKEMTQRITGDARPKQFCRFFGGKSLLTQTRERIAPIFDEDCTLFALAHAHEPFYDDQLAEVHDRRKVVQPANRGTAVAMAICLQTIAKQDEDALVAFFPSDHHYSNLAAFRESVESGLCLMPEYPQSILIVGAEARYPEVEYGWIEPGRTLVDSVKNPLFQVSRFWEKPTVRHANALHLQGCLWNTFVTIGFVGAFRELLQAAVPHLTRLLEGNPELGQLYDKIPPVDFSKAVLMREPERLVVMRDAGSGWTDLGSPRRVLDVLNRQGEWPFLTDRLTALPVRP